MGENTNIEWCDHTFNPWIGCTKVSPGCANCYAETQDKFRSWTPEGWGKGKPRKRTSAAKWKEPLKWNRDASNLTKTLEIGAKLSSRPRVFCASLADWLDDEVPIEWLADLLKLIHDTPHLDWLLLTKRPGNWRKRIEAAAMVSDAAFSGNLAAWLVGAARPNVWIGTTVEDQARADERIPELLKIPARVRFLSCEPLLEKIVPKLSATHANCDECAGTGYYGDNGPGIVGNREYQPCDTEVPRIHWVICGGESGPKARPMHPDWARSLRDQCQAAGVPFFFKQWGEWLPGKDPTDLMPEVKTGDVRLVLSNETDGWGVYARRAGKKAAGRLLDGREWNEFPAAQQRRPTEATAP
jgi:protein gp37